MKDSYAVIGNPISHSKSTLIHQMFAEQTGQDISYEAIAAPLNEFGATIKRLRQAGYRGCNVTVPFKIEAWQLANQLSDRAQVASAVNTLIFADNKIIGDNTDGVGLVRDIEKNMGRAINQQRVLLLGAGGAAQGVVQPLLAAKPACLVISNRTLDKAIKLTQLAQQQVKLSNIPIRALSFSQLAPEQFDLVINATSTGLSDSELPLPNSIFATGALAYDMMYGRATPFIKFAKKNGVETADGLGMLVEQAATAFELWRHVQPDTRPVIAKLRAP